MIFMLQAVKNNYIFLSFNFHRMSLSSRHNFTYYIGDLGSNLGQQTNYYFFSSLLFLTFSVKR
jgi:hypothetical protein